MDVTHDIDAEEQVLGAVLLDDALFAEANHLKTADFYRDKNQWVWAAMITLHQNRKPIGPLTVANQINANRLMDSLGGTDYLNHLTGSCGSGCHTKYFADEIKKYSNQRDLNAAGYAIAEMTFGENEPFIESYGKAIELLMKLKQESCPDGFELVGDIANDGFQVFADWVDGGFQPQGVLSGFTGLDRVIGGFKPGTLTLFAARPSIGKTQLMLRIADNCATRGDTPAFFSLEMTKRDILHRLVFARARVEPQQRLGQPRLDVKQGDRLKDIYLELTSLPLWIDDAANVKTQSAQAKMIQLLAREDIKIMFFDHLGLAGDEDKNQVQRIGKISQGLKAISKICNVPVCAACQLSRALGQRENKRPILEDLRDSGSLEQDADVVIGQYRDEYYHPEGTDKYDESARNIMELLILKQRMGEADPRGYNRTKVFYEVATGYIGNTAEQSPVQGL